MMPPFTLLRLVVAPMIAPAAAPIAASRCVCFTVTSPPDVEPPLLDPTLEPLLPELRLPLEVDRRCVVELLACVVDAVRWTGAAAVPAAVPVSEFEAAARSAGDRLSSGW